MDNDVRYARACRLGLLAAAAVHWAGAAMIMSNDMLSASTWQYSRSVRRLALVLIQTFSAG